MKVFEMEKKSVAKIVTTAVVGGIGLWVAYRIVQSFKKRTNNKPYKPKKNVFVINCEEDWEKFYAMCIENQDVKILGLDCEWVQKRPVALLQLATQHNDCALIRLFQLNSDIPESLQKLLKDKRIFKVGVAVKDDAKKLLQNYGIAVHGCVDLRNIYSRVKSFFECESLGLQGLAQGVLGYDLDKNPAIRMGNWEAKVYTEEQIEYAANDALVGVDIFTQLITAKVHRRRHYGTPNISKLPSEVRFWITAQSLCQGLVDANYRPLRSIRPSRVYQDMVKQIAENEKQCTLTSGDDDDTEEGENSGEEPRTSHRRPKSKECRAYIVRQRPLYHNCYLVAPDDELLCTCDVRKAAWYIEKGLAVQIKDNPLTVKLKFEPSGRPTEDGYYLQEKENICVVCGATDSFIRKCVIPKEYRKYFPHQLKEHSSHDVLLMCVPCHMTSTDHDTALRQKLADECNAPIDSGSGIKHSLDESLRKIQSSAKALLKCKDQLPKERRQELETAVKEFFGVSELSQDLLEEGAKIDYKIYNKHYKPHGKRVVSYMKRNMGLYEFEKMWRKHFIDTMSPHHMPAKWSIDHRNEHYNPKDFLKD